MKIGILGTGGVGRTLALRLHALGHQVQLGTRDPQTTLARTGTSPMGGALFSEWHKDHPSIALRTYAEAAAQGELLINATSGSGSLEALKLAGEANLGDKVMIDISNPLDFSKGMPPTLFVCNDDSLGERIQSTFPQLRVVKSLNTLTAALMLDPGQLPAPTHVFLSGNDAAAKADVRTLLVSCGWGEEDVIDLGDITTARGTEQLLPIWIRLWGALGSPFFNFRIVKA